MRRVGLSPATLAMRDGVSNMVTVSTPCCAAETVFYQQLTRWRSMRETAELGDEELACLAEVLVIALACEGYLLHEIFRDEACVLLTSDRDTLIRMAIP